MVLYAGKLSICTYMYKNASAQGGKKMSNPLELKLLAVSHPLPCWGSNLVPLQEQYTLSEPSFSSSISFSAFPETQRRRATVVKGNSVATLAEDTWLLALFNVVFEVKVGHH